MWGESRQSCDATRVVDVARAINDAGVVVGQSRAIGAPGEHACRWSHGVLQDLGVLPGRLISRANDINDAGQIVGDSRSDILLVAVPQGSSVPGAFLLHGFDRDG